MPEIKPALRPLEIKKDKVTFEWEPLDIHVPPIRRTFIEKRAEPEPTWARIATLEPSVTRYTVPDLKLDTEYRFRLITETHEGRVQPYEYEAPITTGKATGELLFYFIIIHTI